MTGDIDDSDMKRDGRDRRRIKPGKWRIDAKKDKFTGEKLRILLETKITWRNGFYLGRTREDQR